ncbi:MAG: DUF4394 domain-containing protein [Saprospiraceae bacterium]|nr:DUF4394 domain-containing protein [Saprospiraceae bacterium]MBP9194393.1 DUF4394 domain-containing protein [Saprospiraceae bacterium]
MKKNFYTFPNFKGFNTSTLLTTLACLLTLPMFGQLTYGFASGQLISFDAQSPQIIISSTTITGWDVGLTLSGLDSRPATGQLYALGYDQISGSARIYTIDTETAVASPVGNNAITLKPNMGKVSFDFNPTVDRIRVVGSNNANYRLHPVTGALVATDGDLSFATTDNNAGTNPSIGGVAYTNSYIGSAATTLINYDDSLNVFCTQIPPNNGTLNTLGSSGIIVDLLQAETDFDIYFDAASGSNLGFLSSQLTPGSTMLFSVNLTTGLVSPIGNIGLASVSDIAVALPTPSKAEIEGQLAFAINSANSLLSFDTQNPALVRSQLGISGLSAGQSLVGMDFRPATGELYALGYNATNGESQLYTINTTTGAATAVNAGPIVLSLGNGSQVGFDFNPTVDRIRVIAANNANYRLHPVTGAIAATDGSLNFAAADVNSGKNPSIGSGAYTNSFKGATTTTLYVYDDSLNVLCTQVPPNDGILNTLGSSNLTANLMDASGDLDIYYDTENQQNVAYGIVNITGTTADVLYKVNLSTGLFTQIGKVGNGIALRDLAITIDSISTSVSEIKEQITEVVISPNPATYFTRVKFNLTKASDVQIKIMDLTGKLVSISSPIWMSAGQQQVELNTQGLSSGIYVAQVLIENLYTQNIKFVVSQ